MKKMLAGMLSLALLATALPSTVFLANAAEEKEVTVREVSEEEMNQIIEEEREHINDPVTVTDEVTEIRFPETIVANARSGATIAYAGKVDYCGYKVGIFTVNGETAFCMQHNEYNPPNGTAGTDSPYENENIKRVLYYGLGGTEPWSGFENDVHARVLTSLALSYYYYGLPTMSEGDYIFQEGKLRAFLNYCESNPVPNSVITLSKSSLEAYLTSDRTAQRTDTITLNGDSRNKITISLPSGVTLHNTSTGASATGSATIYGGQSFYFTATLQTMGTWSTGTVTGSMKKFMPIVTIPTGS